MQQKLTSEQAIQYFRITRGGYICFHLNKNIGFGQQSKILNALNELGFSVCSYSYRTFYIKEQPPENGEALLKICRKIYDELN